MQAESKSVKLQWLLFGASTAALLLAIYLKWDYLTAIIPFVCTSFVKAMRIM